MAEQINYWARIGMRVERSKSVSSQRMLATIVGDAQFCALTADERVAAHAVIDSRMAERVM